MSDPRAQPPESASHCASRAVFAAIYFPPFTGPGVGPREGKHEKHPATSPGALVDIAQAFSPRYERHGDDFVSMDVAGLERVMLPGAGLSGSVHDHHAPGRAHPAWQVMGEELVQAIAARGVRGHVAIAATRVTAVVLARARPGLTVVPMGDEASSLAPISIDLLTQVVDSVVPPRRVSRGFQGSRGGLRSLGTMPRRKGEAQATPGTDRAVESVAVAMFKQWGLRTLGELAALPAAELTSRLGRPALVWQAIARGEDVRPLVPTEPEERFDAALELEWPIEGLEPLSFVLTRLFEPLSTRLERRDRGAATIHVALDLVTGDTHARHLQLPSPIRDVRTLRTLVLLDIESHPPPAAIDRVEVVIDPTPGRVLQHTLFTRAIPTPERLSTLLARLVAVMGQDRIGAPVMVDTYRPGAFEMQPFATEHKAGQAGGRMPPVSQRSTVSSQQSADQRAAKPSRGEPPSRDPEPRAPSLVISALRRCRQPVPARVVVEAGRPVRITTDRRGFVGGTVTSSTGPWRTSGDWWKQPAETGKTSALSQSAWDRDEWDVALTDGAIYRVFQDRQTHGWFIDGIFD